MSTTVPRAPVAHVRPVSPVAFPDRRPETQLIRRSQRHSHLCIALAQMLRTITTNSKLDAPPSRVRSGGAAAAAAAAAAALASAIGYVGKDTLIYLRANDPSIFVEPDAFVRLGAPLILDDSTSSSASGGSSSWKVWERGAPDVVFEILSPSDSGEVWSLDEKIERYTELGARELVVFDVDDLSGHRLRVWDRVDGDFVERVVENEHTPCLTLTGFTLTVAPVLLDIDVEYPACLRLVRTADDRLVPTTREATIAADDARRAADQALQDKEAAESAAAEASMAGAQSQRAEAQARGDAEAEKRRTELAAARARRS